MTDGIDQALVNGGLDLLRADLGPPALQVFDGAVPNGTNPSLGYVLVYATVEWPSGAEGDALDGISGTPTVRWITHSVSTTAMAARGVQQRVRTALLNKRLTIAGLDCGLIRQEVGAGPPTRDDTTGTTVFDVVATYRTFAT
ncbi:hypothetical protein Drose_04155 [Dactylosporangium roseum]|uniref:DUF3168 domain-containing protein n=1 Tax=Dactylosporangium roseum TaxID=47989 RepID=A0ABY5Z9I7_9ACTN|nr:hypothetical protein [Dactylosporangium roseum]UWZ37482.1 hypothetical protein Drose_04155 [Dactylosporangium roseum]